MFDKLCQANLFCFYTRLVLHVYQHYNGGSMISGMYSVCVCGGGGGRFADLISLFLYIP